MKAFVKFFLKLCGCLLAAAAAGFAISYAAFASAWGALAAPAALVGLYFVVYKCGQWTRLLLLKRKEKRQNIRLKTEDGFSFRDLNKNGKLDIYEDPRQPIDARVEDLLSQMTIEEKAGLLFSPQMNVVPAGKIAVKGGFCFGGDAVYHLFKRNINTFCATGAMPPKAFAKWHNALQRAAECTRLGIPVTICSDPRHIYVHKTNPLAVQKDDGISSWPSPLGFGAMRDEEETERYGRIAAAELRAMGIRFALSPSADTATEPRWGRIQETFGENAQWNGRLAAAYVRGMQDSQIGKNSVACCVKHFPGGGPQKNGDDPHFAFGKEQVYPGDNFAYHLKPFQSVIAQGVSAVMPYYGVPVGLSGVEPVGFNFNHRIVTDLLRKELGFQGIVHSDYSIIEGLKVFGMSCIPGRAWGVEKKNTGQKLKQVLEAGVDQIGGECCSGKLVKAVRAGLVPQSIVDAVCRRILHLKFALGLFDDPFVDPQNAQAVCGKKEFVQMADDAMRRSLVLLKNELGQNPWLPLQKNIKIYSEGFLTQDIQKFALPVSCVEDADAALIWLDVPKYIDKRDPMTAMFSCGSLAYPSKTVKHVVSIMQKKPTILVIHMLRPVVIPEFQKYAAAIIADFSVKPEIILEAVFGDFAPTGKLPFDLPLTLQDAANQKSDVPFDCKHKAFAYGDGLTYRSAP